MGREMTKPASGRRAVLDVMLAVVLAGLVSLAGGAVAQERFIVMASTTSTQQSGLFSHLLPAFKKDTGVDVRVVALGTGQALDMAREVGLETLGKLQAMALLQHPGEAALA